MHESMPILADLMIIIAASLAVLFLFRRLSLPPIAGFVLTGIIIGPSGLGWIKDATHVDTASEIGVVLLLFTVGLEVSLSRLLKTSIRIYLLAIGQIVFTSLFGFGAAYMLGVPFATSVVIGFVLATSSSAIVLKGLSDRGELESPLGRMVVTICLAQDFAVVPMLVILGLLQPHGTGPALIPKVLQVLALGGALFLAARYVLPEVLRRVMAINATEVVLLVTLLILFGTAWLTSLAGLSLAIGAFAAGLILSETEYYPQIYAEVAPFRTLFSSLFFVSIGMLLDLQFVAMHPFAVLGVALGVLLLKSLVIFGVALPLGLSPRVALQSGFYLAQIGEFSFLIIGTATAGALLTDNEFQYLMGAATITLAVTPLIMQWSPRLVGRAQSRFPWLADLTPHDTLDLPTVRPKPAVLIIGFGVNGHNIARVLHEAGIYCEILDNNPELVRRARSEGQLIHFGDVSRPEVLRQLDVSGFDSIVLTIAEVAATRRAVSLIRDEVPHAYMIVRTRLVAEVDELERLGANIVVPEEFETSLRIFGDLLHHYRIPPHIISMQMEAVRGHSYGVLRTQAGSSVMEQLEQLILQRLVEAVPILPGSPVIGRTIASLGLVEESACTILSVMRNGYPLRPPFEEAVLEPSDLIVLYGNHMDLEKAVERLTHLPKS
jgi:CPA2 family monovalent cation:H+ antiporter-2